MSTIAEEPRVNIDRQYRWKKINFEDLARVSGEILHPFCQPDPKFECKLIEAGPSQLEEIYSSLLEWKEAAKASFVRTSVAVRPGADYSSRISLDIDFAKHTANLRMSVPLRRKEDAKKALAEIETQLGLVPVDARQPARAIEYNANFRITKPETALWLIEGLNVISEQFAGLSGFDGKIVRRTVSNVTQSYADASIWQDDLKNQWTEIDRTTVSLYGGSCRVALACDFTRSEINLQLSAPNQQDVEAAAKKIRESLKLNQLIEPASRQDREGATKRFWVRRGFDDPWIARWMDLLRSLQKGQVYFNGRLSSESLPEKEKMNTSFSGWEKIVTEQWKALDRLNAWLSNSEYSVSFDCDLRRELVRLEVQAEKKQLVELFARFESELTLEPVKDEPYRYPRYNHVYTLLKPPTNEAMAQAIEEAIKNFLPKHRVARAMLVAEGDDSPQTNYTILDELIKELRQSNQRFSRVSVYLQAPRGNDLAVEANMKEMQLDLRATLGYSDFLEVITIFKKYLGLKLKSKETQTGTATESDKPTFFSKYAMPIGSALLGSALFSGLVAEAIPRRSLMITVPFVKEGETIKHAAFEIPVEWRSFKKQFWEDHANDHDPALVRVLDTSWTETKNVTGIPPLKIPLTKGTNHLEITLSHSGLKTRFDVVVEDKK